MRKFLLALVFVAVASPLYAQSVDTIKQSTPFKVAADHDGADTDGFKMYLNGAVWQAKAVTDLVAGIIQFDLPVGLMKGVYVIYIEAYSTTGAGASTTVTLTVTTGNPAPPRNLRVVKPTQ
jgi:hypothetical protein